MARALAAHLRHEVILNMREPRATVWIRKSQGTWVAGDCQTGSFFNERNKQFSMWTP